MSTPRPQVEDRCAVCGWPLAETRENGCRPGDCSMRPFPEHIFDIERANREYAGLHKFPVPEGVAAPLEPSRLDIETFVYKGFTSRQLAYRIRRNSKDNIAQLMRNFAEAYAAAVSKNLQQQNVHLIKEGLRVDADADKWMNRAAKAETELENLQQELAHAVSCMDRSCKRCNKVQREIAALRETK
jgi:hypothetical protein